MVSHDRSAIVGLWVAAFAVIAVMHGAVISAIFGPLMTTGIRDPAKFLYLVTFLFFGSMFILAMMVVAPLRSANWQHRFAKLSGLLFSGGFAVWIGGDLTGRSFELAATFLSWTFSVYFIGGRIPRMTFE